MSELLSATGLSTTLVRVDGASWPLEAGRLIALQAPATKNAPRLLLGTPPDLTDDLNMAQNTGTVDIDE